jgi:hypothetical protein
MVRSKFSDQHPVTQNAAHQTQHEMTGFMLFGMIFLVDYAPML